MPNMCRLRIRLGLALRCILRFAVYLVRFTYIDLVDTVTATSAGQQPASRYNQGTLMYNQSRFAAGQLVTCQLIAHRVVTWSTHHAKLDTK